MTERAIGLGARADRVQRVSVKSTEASNAV